jgi:anti-sigma factor (TIGR02949 family)
MRGSGTGFGPVVLSAGPTACLEVLRRIQLYADGECDQAVSCAIAAHVERCPHCSRELRQLYWLKAAVRRCADTPESGPWP